MINWKFIRKGFVTNRTAKRINRTWMNIKSNTARKMSRKR